MVEETMKTKKESARRISRIVLLSSLIVFSFVGLLLAEDYPSNFIGPGYREYLYGKIQDGYYVDAFAKLDVSLKTKIDKRNQIEDILNNSYRARPETNYSILSAEYEKRVTEQETVQAIAKTRQEREQGAAAQGEFYYIPYADGKKEYFKDGLLWRIENELIKDQFGNESRKNTYNIKYNDKRLMIGYESTSTNTFGDSTYNLFEADYTEDSVYYGTEDSVANKLMSRYRITEIDASGHKSVISWTADGYVGKFLTGFRETVDSEVYGHSEVHRYDIVYDSADPNRPTSYKEHGTKNGTTYDLVRSNIEYLDLGEGQNPLMLKWHEVYSDTDGNRNEQDYANEYYVNGTSATLLSTTIKYTRSDISGTVTQGWSKTIYSYDKNNVLESATGYGEYTATDVDGTTTTTGTTNDTYEVIHGHAKVVKSETGLSIKGPSGTTNETKRQTFTYDQWGLHMLSSEGAAVGSTISPSGDTTYFYNLETYGIIWGEAKILSVTGTSYTFNLYNENPDNLGPLTFADLTNAGLLEKYLANSDSHNTSTKTFTYLDNGRLQSVTGEVDTYVQTITGDVYHTNTKEEYEVRFNQSFLTDQTMHTTGENTLSGNTWEEMEKLHYDYGEYSSSETGNNSKYALIGVHQGEVTLNGVTAVGKVSISKGLFQSETGEYTSTTTTITQSTYEVKYGQSYITQSVSTSNTENLVQGSFSTRVQTTNFTYGWINFQGQQYYTATSQNVSITSEGHDISGNSWHSISPETYTLNFQLCTYDGKQYWGIPEGTKIETSYTIAGQDPYNNVYTETVTNSYEYKYGQPWLMQSTSVRETHDTRSDKSKEHTTTNSTTTYAYGEISFGGKTYYGLLSTTFTSKSEGVDDEGKSWSSEAETYTLTNQVCEYNGKKYWGVPEGTVITTTYKTTSDGKDATVTNTYEIKYGQLLLIKNVVSGEGGSSTTANNYGWITYEGKQYYAIESQDYNLAEESFHLTFSAQTYNGVNYWGLEEGKTYTRVDVQHETQSGSETVPVTNNAGETIGYATTSWSVDYEITITKNFKIVDGSLKFMGADVDVEVTGSSVVTTVNITIPAPGGVGTLNIVSVYAGTIDAPPVPGVSIPISVSYTYNGPEGSVEINLTAPQNNYDPVTGALVSVTYTVNQSGLNTQGVPIWVATPTTITIPVAVKPYQTTDENGQPVTKTTTGLVEGFSTAITYTVNFANGAPSQTFTDTYMVLSGIPMLADSARAEYSNIKILQPVAAPAEPGAVPTSGGPGGETVSPTEMVQQAAAAGWDPPVSALEENPELYLTDPGQALLADVQANPGNYFTAAGLQALNSNSGDVFQVIMANPAQYLTPQGTSALTSIVYSPQTYLTNSGLILIFAPPTP